MRFAAAVHGRRIAAFMEMKTMFRLQSRGALAAIALAACGAFGGAAAQTTPSVTTTPSRTAPATTETAQVAQQLPRAERRFLEDAAVGSLAELELGKLAQQRAASEQVKQFAARIVQDHTQAGDELKSVAAGKNVTLPTALPRNHQRDMERLAKLSGNRFDREYMKHMVSDHKKDVAAFGKMAKNAKDPQVRDFASRTLPTLEEHLRLARAADAAAKKAG